MPLYIYHELNAKGLHEIPIEFADPVTGKFLQDPFSSQDGFSYEKSEKDTSTQNYYMKEKRSVFTNRSFI